MSLRVVVPNVLTMANISVGFLAVLAAGHDRFTLAVWLIVAAILLDMFDGRVARWLGATSAFGQQLDSFSDAVSSGVAPAYLVHRAALAPLGWVGAAVSLAYLLAGVGRLTRFNLTSDVHTKARTTVGVPIPVAAGYMLALAVMRDRMSPSATAAVVLVLAGLMISRLHLPELRGNDVVGLFMAVGIGTYFWVLLRPGWLPVGIWNGWNVVILATAAWLERRQPASGADSSMP
ncbi:MAG TPA: CDP-diacylglycerol--serine O-phosphatidyltransferase [Thermoanaerobaculaceae bacterium]|nr:CDP-diacylglycerol--serine O-phosphatidyltransferase [Thermoanaerobaculaceae bacterium]HRS14731.1 CDP-diacylglycerol--serine O-phosphatidyltransferase [Thermoanaerobaculaceae bacterium]